MGTDIGQTVKVRISTIMHRLQNQRHVLIFSYVLRSVYVVLSTQFVIYNNRNSQRDPILCGRNDIRLIGIYNSRTKRTKSEMQSSVKFNAKSHSG